MIRSHRKKVHPTKRKVHPTKKENPSYTQPPFFAQQFGGVSMRQPLLSCPSSDLAVRRGAPKHRGRTQGQPPQRGPKRPRRRSPDQTTAMGRGSVPRGLGGLGVGLPETKPPNTSLGFEVHPFRGRLLNQPSSRLCLGFPHLNNKVIPPSEEASVCGWPLGVYIPARQQA